VKALEKTLAILAFVVLVSQTVRHAYLLWLEPRISVLDKYDQPLKNEIASARSLDELVRRYDPVRKQVDAAKEQAKSEEKPVNEYSNLEPYKSERTLREAIKEWEDRSKQIREIWFYCSVAFVLFILGTLLYRKWNRWLGLTLLISSFCEFIYWTSPTFLGPNTHEFDRLLVQKLVFSIVVLALLLVAIRLNGIFLEERKPSPA